MVSLTHRCMSVLNLPSSDGIKDGGDGNNSILDDCTVSGVFDCNYKGGV